MSIFCLFTTREFKGNFPFHMNQLCPKGCKEIDTQEHILQCEKVYPLLTRDTSISYNDIFSDNIDTQAAIVQLFATLLERREDTSASTTGPSCCHRVDSNSSHSCID